MSSSTASRTQPESLTNLSEQDVPTGRKNFSSQAPLMVSVSGVRGIVGESLTTDVVRAYVRSFASLKRNSKIVVGRDSRISGPEIFTTVVETLRCYNCDVISLDIVPTPTVQLLVLQHNAAGGIVITASHNPIEWNGLKFVDNDGCFCSPQVCEQIFSKAAKLLSETYIENIDSPPNDYGSLSVYDDAIHDHITSILQIPCVDAPLIAKRKFKVALDTVNGAGGPIMSTLLSILGCTVIPLNIDTSGNFAHPPEPIPENLDQLCKVVVENQCDLGIATDPDVDRCVLVGNDGKPLGEELTLVLALQHFLSSLNPNPEDSRDIVKNCSTSCLVDYVAKQHQYNVVESKVGEINVAQKMSQLGSVIGGEGNGGVMVTQCHIGRDAPVAASLVLSALAHFNGSILELRNQLPVFEMVKTKKPVPSDLDIQSLLEPIVNSFSDRVVVSTLDGVKISSVADGKNKWWVHLRPSNTEPIIRIIAECGPGAGYSCVDLIEIIEKVL
ncbi:hypothetical protein GEMRC1_007511 [Eukaryota sp. GEM-RC1]